MRVFLWTALAGFAFAAQPTTVETKQLTVTISANRDTVVSGQPVTLTLDIGLQPKMHVYAPGVEHYIPIDWKIDSNPAVKIQRAAWPKAEKLRLDAIDETVAAYTGKFSVTRRIVFAPGAKGSVTIHGTLRYQACDDRMCYIPASVPLEWTFSAAQK